MAFIETRLPSISGLDLYLAIRRLSSSVSAIMITDDSAESRELAQRAVRQSAFASIQKPIDHAEVLRLIERYVGKVISGQPGKFESL